MTRKKVISDLMPESGTLLLTGTGKEFVRRVGEQLVKDAVLGVLLGENLRTQTEYLTRSRISQVSSALVYLYVCGKIQISEFTHKLSSLAADQLRESKRNNNADMWPAQWFIGLTGKSVQNVLKSDHAILDTYVARFQESLSKAITNAEKEYGLLHGTMGFVKNGKSGSVIKLDWRDILQLTTVIGAQTLTIRGSDKSMYGKLFEKLILGSVLSILGYKRTSTPDIGREKIFWLSDGANNRESDATLVYKPAKLVRFDIGFIGPGNPEISKDKLSRFSTEENYLGKKTYTKTIIIVDRLPKTGKTEASAKEINADIIQMSMLYWPRNLAIALSRTTGERYPLQTMSDDTIRSHLEKKLAKLSMLDFLENVSLSDIASDEE